MQQHPKFLKVLPLPQMVSELSSSTQYVFLLEQTAIIRGYLQHYCKVISALLKNEEPTPIQVQRKKTLDLIIQLDKDLNFNGKFGKLLRQENTLPLFQRNITLYLAILGKEIDKLQTELTEVALIDMTKRLRQIYKNLRCERVVQKPNMPAQLWPHPSFGVSSDPYPYFEMSLRVEESKAKSSDEKDKISHPHVSDHTVEVLYNPYPIGSDFIFCSRSMQRLAPQHSLVACFPAHSRLALEHAYLQFALKQQLINAPHQLNSSDIQHIVCRVFNERPGWLLIFVDVPDYKAVQSYLKNIAPVGHIKIITAHQEGWPSSYRLTPFAMESKLNFSALSTGVEDPIIQQLYELLAHPLAVQQACELLKFEKIDIHEFRKIYSQSESKAIHFTVSALIKFLRRQAKQKNVLAQQMIQLLTLSVCFDREKVPILLFQHWLEKYNLTASDEARTINVDCLKNLQQLGLIVINGSTFYLHSTVQSNMQPRIDFTQSLLKQVLTLCTFELTEIAETSEAFSNNLDCVLHLQAIVQRAGKAVKPVPELEAKAHYFLALTYRQFNMKKRGEAALRKAYHFVMNKSGQSFTVRKVKLLTHLVEMVSQDPTVLLQNRNLVTELQAITAGFHTALPPVLLFSAYLALAQSNYLENCEAGAKEALNAAGEQYARIEEKNTDEKMRMLLKFSRRCLVIDTMKCPTDAIIALEAKLVEHSSPYTSLLKADADTVLGEIYCAQGHFPSAKKFLQQALMWHYEQKDCISFSPLLKNLARCNAALGNPIVTLDFIEQALVTQIRYGYEASTHTCELLFLLSDTYQTLGHQALSYQVLQMLQVDTPEKIVLCYQQIIAVLLKIEHSHQVRSFQKTHVLFEFYKFLIKNLAGESPLVFHPQQLLIIHIFLRLLLLVITNLSNSLANEYFTELQDWFAILINSMQAVTREELLSIAQHILESVDAIDSVAKKYSQPLLTWAHRLVKKHHHDDDAQAQKIIESLFAEIRQRASQKLMPAALTLEHKVSLKQRGHRSRPPATTTLLAKRSLLFGFEPNEAKLSLLLGSPAAEDSKLDTPKASPVSPPMTPDSTLSASVAIMPPLQLESQPELNEGVEDRQQPSLLAGATTQTGDEKSLSVSNNPAVVAADDVRIALPFGGGTDGSIQDGSQTELRPYNPQFLASLSSTPPSSASQTPRSTPLSVMTVSSESGSQRSSALELEEALRPVPETAAKKKLPPPSESKGFKCCVVM